MVGFRAEPVGQDSLVKRQAELQLAEKLLGRRLERLLDLPVVYFYEGQRSRERCQRPEFLAEIFTGLGDALTQEREVLRRSAVDC